MENKIYKFQVLNDNFKKVKVCLDIILKKTFNIIEYISKNYDVLNKSIQDFKDRKKVNIYFATLFLDNKKGLTELFLNKKICPPIFYLMNQGTFENVLNEENFHEKSINIEDLIFSSDVKDYYLEQIENWAEEETENYMKNYIKEIKFNFQNDNIYVTTLNLFTLIEYKINTVIDKNQNLIIKDKYIIITETIKNVLKEHCFCYEEESKLIDIYNKFLDKNSNIDLYKSTDYSTNITRHMLHGKKLNLINKKDMLSLIFFTDCIYKMLFIEK